MNWKNLIDDYEFYLRIERGLAENTVQNYSSDIFALAQFISSNNIDELPKKLFQGDATAIHLSTIKVCQLQQSSQKDFRHKEFL